MFNHKIEVGFTDQSAVPPGVKIVDMNNKEINTITTTGSGRDYKGKFKVIYPASVVQNQSGSVQISLRTNVYNHGIYYASCAEVDKYGKLQNYMCDTDPVRPMKVTTYSNYKK